MREFQLCGLGNSLVDIFIEISDAELAQLQLERGTMRLVEAAEQRSLLEQFHTREPRLVSGGSVANSVIAFSQLGGQAAFLGCVADDRYGLFYETEFEELGIDFANPPLVGETSGTCLCLITPDAERTMRTCLAVSSHLAAHHVDERIVRNSDWIFVEGYLFANPTNGQPAIREALRLAKKHDVRIALTCSEAFVPQAFTAAFADALGQADLLFCNRSEACAITGAEDAASAFARLRGLVPSCVVTDGGHGAYVRHDEIEAHVPAFSCEPKDLTGAGDMLAGSFLYGITHGVPADQAARAACFLAMKVITQMGARLHHGVPQFWKEIVG